MRLTRRQFLLAGSAVLGATGGYSVFYEPFNFEVTHTKISISGGQQTGASPLRILHLSDLHLSRWVTFDHLAQAIGLGLAEKPDVICLTGDYISRGRDYDFAEYATFLRQHLGSIPVFASLGNHDGGSWSSRGGYGTTAPVEECLDAAGFTVLVNRGVTITVRNRQISLIGIADLWSGVPNPVLAWKSFVDHGQCKIVLSHNPDTKKLLNDFSWDLMLCGHTHGGQVVVPFWGAPYVPVDDPDYISGLYSYQGRPLYITRGVGNLHGIRFNCRPEVSLLDLV